jgi:hypothetical protein
LVLTFGRFSVVDIFDTNKYANSAKNDFLNWSSANVGSFDYAGDAWAYTQALNTNMALTMPPSCPSFSFSNQSLCC